MQTQKSLTIALAGNPNVGKSTVFNNLTGLNQHTGNWTGKTVQNARGKCKWSGTDFVIMDLPGIYSIISGSSEEELARNYICFDSPDAVIVVADATSLERNLNLLLQIIEITDNVVLCLNLMDEAKKKKIIIDQKKLAEILKIPVIATTATKRKGVFDLLDAARNIAQIRTNNTTNITDIYLQTSSSERGYKMNYGKQIETAIEMIIHEVERLTQGKINSRFIALKMLGGENNIIDETNFRLNIDLFGDKPLSDMLDKAKFYLNSYGISSEAVFVEDVVSRIVYTCEEIAQSVVTFQNPDYNEKHLKIDRILTSRQFGVPIMLALLGIIFFITIELANFPSQWLASFFSLVEKQFNRFFVFIHAPSFIHYPIMNGIFRTTAWVISVMLPPMAIFFPLFTLLEDFGYLPRVAFNLDKPFKKCGCCGKQSLTMCMGFGCNAAAIVGTRIIDSPREKLIAIITNNFVPCNGRFPTLITLSSVTVSVFFMGGVVANSLLSGLVSTLTITVAVLVGILATFLVSLFLNKTFLKGLPSSFNLELPPYRKPQIGKVLVRSLLDRTIKVLGRAIIIAAPCGLVIWLLANINVSGAPLLYYIARFLQPLGKLMGLDGYILTSFILGFPANEIVLPIAVMSYTDTATLAEIGSISALGMILKDNGWTMLTAVNTMIFCLFHFPCATTCLSIKKETKSIRWTLLSVILPTAMGIFLCMGVTGAVKLFSLFL